MILIKNGRVVLDGGILPADVLLSGGTITDVSQPGAFDAADAQVIDAAGGIVSPGFVDIHVHGGGGSDFMDGEADTYRRAVMTHLRHGTTSLMPTTLSAGFDSTLGAIRSYKAAKADAFIGKCLLGMHMEGPYLSAAQAGAQKPGSIRAFDKTEYLALIAAADGHIRRWSVAPELAGAYEFADIAAQNGITLSIAHSNADFDTVVQAFDRGYRHVTHLYSGMSTITRRDGFRIAGVLEAAFFLDGMNVEIIADGCHLPIPLLQYVVKFKQKDKIALISDAMRAAGEDATESFLGSRQDPQPVIIEDGVAKLLSRDAFGGSVATADRLVKTMLRAGVPLIDCIDMITVNPLRMMHLTDKKGRIQKGFDADICIFDEQIAMQTVIKAGESVL